MVHSSQGVYQWRPTGAPVGLSCNDAPGVSHSVGFGVRDTSCMKLHTQLPFQVDDIHLLGASIVDWNQTSGASGSIVCRRCDWRLLQTFGPISQWRFPSRRHEFESVIERRQKWCVLIRGAGCCSNSSGCMDFATRTYRNAPVATSRTSPSRSG